MIEINKKEIPYTKGKGYEYITREDFLTQSRKMELYSLKDLVAGNDIIIYRVAKMYDTGEIVFQKMKASLIIVIPDYTMTYSYVNGVKIMKLDGYKKDWFFIKEEDLTEC